MDLAGLKAMDDNLKIWVKHITAQDMPIFENTASDIAQVTEADASSSYELAQAILKDSSLTARILKVANSPLFNRCHIPVTTVSRAVMYLGFQRVRDISLSLSIIDTILQDRVFDHLHSVMAQSFHAAVQAKYFAEMSNKDSAEEYFIAALLYNLGEMTFWSLSGKAGENILAEIKATGLASDKAQQYVLGTTFKHITYELIATWHLSDLLQRVLEQGHYVSTDLEIILLAQKLASTVRYGWNSDSSAAVIREVARYLSIPIRQAEINIQENAVKAAEVAKSYGAGKAAVRIPSENMELVPALKTAAQIADFPKTNPALQLSMLRKLSIDADTHPSINKTIQTVLEGMHAGIGLDRVVFALYNSDKSSLKAKFTKGIDKDFLLHNFVMPSDWFTKKLFKGRDIIWLCNQGYQSANNPMSDLFKSTLQSDEFFLAPVFVNKQEVGIIYADRRPSERKLDDVSFDSFKHFCLQGSLVLEHISRNNIPRAAN